MSIWAFINHRFLASAEVHCILFSRLDLKLYAVRRSDVNIWQQWTSQVGNVFIIIYLFIYLPWTTVMLFCLFAIIASLVKASNRWSHWSTKSPLDKGNCFSSRKLCMKLCNVAPVKQFGADMQPIGYDVVSIVLLWILVCSPSVLDHWKQRGGSSQSRPDYWQKLLWTQNHLYSLRFTNQF